MKWFKCSDKPAPCDVWVLVYVPCEDERYWERHGVMPGMREIQSSRGGIEVWCAPPIYDCDPFECIEPTHWALLPEPPNE